jgi:hypothetical protein
MGTGNKQARLKSAAAPAGSAFGRSYPGRDMIGVLGELRRYTAKTKSIEYQELEISGQKARSRALAPLGSCPYPMTGFPIFRLAKKASC